MGISPRKRAGTFEVFERRYKPIEHNGSILREWDDPEVTAAFDRKDYRYVWTVVDCDGKLYLIPGFHTVNYMNRVLCEVPWCDVEEANPGYVYG